MSEALRLLHQRNSAPRLVEPAPSVSELNEIFCAAARAPDHGQLRPWRFIVIEGKGRVALGELFVSVQPEGAAEEKRQKMRANPLRAPMIIVVVACPVEDSKIPVKEQQLSAACTAHAILYAAEALGYAAIWRTGDVAYHPDVERGLGLADLENIIGFLYLGTRDGEAKELNIPDIKSKVVRWPS